jgi:hypothetical protein
MPQAGEGLAALQRDGWVELRRKEPRRSLAKGDRRATPSP